MINAIKRGLTRASAFILLSSSAAFAVPTINSISTTYSAAGKPTSITVNGSGFCSLTCVKPTVGLSGLGLTVSTATPNTLTATLPSTVADGEYTLSVTAGTTGIATEPFVIKSSTAVSVGTVTTLAAGSAATVTNTGTATAPVLAFGIPRGAAGAGVQNFGSGNTSVGASALPTTSTGGANTATGFGALLANTTGGSNTATGYEALYLNNIGAGNTAFGSQALYSNTSGLYNTASGLSALFANTTGNYNTAYGVFALQANTTGQTNTALGTDTLSNNSTGTNNVAVGEGALFDSGTGSSNTAVGAAALYQNLTGGNNTAIGYLALGYGSSAGSSNIALGYEAGYQSTGNFNIDIGNQGVAGESGVLRIGASDGIAGLTTKAFIAGINGVTTGLTASAVVIDANGQLGTVSSSRRYKEDIEPMGEASERLFKLRPVRFHYKQPDAAGQKPIQYGLIAEEVAEVFPELTVYNKSGQPESVAYHLLAGLLLNELQKEHQQVQTATAELDALKVQFAEVQQLKQKLAEFEATAAELRAQQVTISRMLDAARREVLQRVSDVTQ